MAKSPRGKRTLPLPRLTVAAIRQAVDFLATAEECFRLTYAYRSLQSGQPCEDDDGYPDIVERAFAALPKSIDLAKRNTSRAIQDMLIDAFDRLQDHVKANQKGYGDRLRMDLLRFRIKREFDRSIGKAKSQVTRTSGGVTIVVKETKWTATALRKHLAGTFQLANESSVRKILGRRRGRSPA